MGTGNRCLRHPLTVQISPFKILNMDVVGHAITFHANQIILKTDQDARKFLAALYRRIRNKPNGLTYKPTKVSRFAHRTINARRRNLQIIMLTDEIVFIQRGT